MANMQGFGMMIDKLKKNPKTIVFTEGTDPRIQEAASRLLASYFLTPILVGKESEIFDAAEENGYNIRGAKILDPEKYDKMDEMVEKLCELRKNKNMQPEEARKLLFAGELFRNNAGKDGSCGRFAGRSYLFYGRYGASGSSDYQDEAGTQRGKLLLYHGSSFCNR